jgi:hypothetical protein
MPRICETFCLAERTGYLCLLFSHENPNAFVSPDSPLREKLLVPISVAKSHFPGTNFCCILKPSEHQLMLDLSNRSNWRK